MQAWVDQLNNRINSITKLKEYIYPTEEEIEAIETLGKKWGTTPYFASLMDRNDSPLSIIL